MESMVMGEGRRRPWKLLSAEEEEEEEEEEE